MLTVIRLFTTQRNTTMSRRSQCLTDLRGMKPCRTCFGYLGGEVENYIQTFCGYRTYGNNTFPARFPWEVKKTIFRPLVAHIFQLAKDTRTYHHYVYDLVYLNRIFDYRYVGTAYSFSFALVEYRYMMERLYYIDNHLFNDAFIREQIHLLKEGLAEEIQKAQTGYFWRACSCGSCIVSPEEFAAKTCH